MGTQALAPVALQAEALRALDGPLGGFGVAFAISFVVQLVIGALVVGVGGRWSYEVMAEAHDDLGSAMLLGIFGPFGVVIAAVVLAITIVGIVISIPLLLLLAAISFVGTPLGAAVVGGRITGKTDYDDRWPALVVGIAVLAGATVVPVFGELLNLVVASPGIGVLLRRSWHVVRN